MPQALLTCLLSSLMTSRSCTHRGPHRSERRDGHPPLPWANSHAIVGPPRRSPRKGDVCVSWLPLYHDMGSLVLLSQRTFTACPWSSFRPFASCEDRRAGLRLSQSSRHHRVCAKLCIRTRHEKGKGQLEKWDSLVCVILMRCRAYQSTVYGSVHRPIPRTL